MLAIEIYKLKKKKKRNNKKNDDETKKKYNSIALSVY